ncbi:MAG: hypothetical protein AAB870_00610 [Patescibacteria group bacterium]
MDYKKDILESYNARKKLPGTTLKEQFAELPFKNAVLIFLNEDYSILTFEGGLAVGFLIGVYAEPKILIHPYYLRYGLSTFEQLIDDINNSTDEFPKYADIAKKQVGLEELYDNDNLDDNTENKVNYCVFNQANNLIHIGLANKINRMELDAVVVLSKGSEEKNLDQYILPEIIDRETFRRTEFNELWQVPTFSDTLSR